MPRLIVNIIGFQVGWFSCILSARWNIPWMGMAVVSVVILLHLFLQQRPRTEAVAILLIATAGASLDTLLHMLGLLSLVDHPRPDPLFPLWIAALWANFAATLTTTFGWLRHRLALAAVLGLIGGPTTYYAGVALDAVEFHTRQGFTWAALGIQWFLAMPAAVWLAHTINRRPDEASTPSLPGEEGPG